MMSSHSKTYRIAEVEEITGISAFTIRYYDKCGFFPELKRDAYGSRVFDDADVEQLHLIDALRRSGLSIEGIGYFIRLYQDSGKIEDSIAILRERAAALDIQRAEMDNCALLIAKTIEDLEKEATRNTFGDKTGP